MAFITVIEGCDGAGKTTLAEDLKTIHECLTGEQASILHFGPPTHDNMFTEYVKPVALWLDKNRFTNKHLIIDRFHIGELVYGAEFRGESRLSLMDLRDINIWLQNEGAMCIYLRPSPATIKQRLRERGDDMVNVEHIDSIISLYDLYLHYDEPMYQNQMWTNVNGIMQNRVHRIADIVRDMNNSNDTAKVEKND